MKKTTKRIPNAMDVLQWPDSPWVKSKEERASMTIGCKDAEEFPRVSGAGDSKSIGGQQVQIMHNGLLVLKNGYQGEWEARIIKQLRGVHEPQEEKVFLEVLKRVESGSIMMELGSWWSYYSMWFLKNTNAGRAYCTEPDPVNIELGRNNAKLNGFIENKDIHFRQYVSGAIDSKEAKFKTEEGTEVTVPVRSVDSILSEENIEKLEILHFDIQGAELETLKGAKKSITDGRVRFIFISTHHYSISNNPNIHQECIDYIKNHGGHIIAKHTVLESCSGDGLIVASFDPKDASFRVKVTLQPTDESLFRNAEKDTKILADAYDALQLEKEKMQQILEAKQGDIEALRKQAEKQKSDIKRLESFIEDITPLKKHLVRQINQKIRRTNSNK